VDFILFFRTVAANPFRDANALFLLLMPPPPPICLQTPFNELALYLFRRILLFPNCAPTWKVDYQFLFTLFALTCIFISKRDSTPWFPPIHFPKLARREKTIAFLAPAFMYFKLYSKVKILTSGSLKKAFLDFRLQIKL